MSTSIGAITGIVFEAIDNAHQIEPITADHPDFSEADAYAVTAGLRAKRSARSEKSVGRKIGFTNRTIWEEYGVYAPIWGDVYDSTVYHTADDASGTLSLAGLCEPRIEPEIVFGVGAGIREDMDDGELIAALDWVAHGFEIVQSIYPDWQFQIADTIACGALHGRMIVGPKTGISDWQPADLARDLAEFTIELSCNGEHVDTGAGANVLDSPLNALRHLAAVLDDDPYNSPVAAGEIITTGTLTRAFPVSAGERWTTQLSGLELPGLNVAFS